MKGLVRAAAVAASFLLSGCLVSSSPLFDASNASATPFGAGTYDACSGSTANNDLECNPMTIELGDNGLYTLGVEDDRIEARFHDLGGGDYAIQMTESSDDDYMYYWGKLDNGAMKITLLWCSDLPRALVDKLIKDGSVEADKDYTTCTVKTPGAVIVAAKSYAAGEAVSDDFVEIKPAPSAQ
ncbi:MAG: hypothetical protein AAB227_01615 [Pseudomonadota bacterium]